ncbi:hypothetical protein CEXT_441081 [Caerostris extrusa]|uniref:Uncharacterized protein n=1 Tax=Caerostris extrusa TaxID=172846 RepID=A0AAV4NH84_CAEEX|nr:hypothetical protein CEXT_441081 [Caerostris extrusa]
MEVSHDNFIRRADSCRIINCIRLPESYHNDENSSLERLIEKCPLLETLDVSTFFNLSALKNCYRNIAVTLQNHPKLVSLGDTDSSWAAHHIHTTCRTDRVPRFGLKDCFWGYNINVQRFNRNQIAYIQQFPEFVKSSVILFPLVEKLRIVVYNEDCIDIYFPVERNRPSAEVSFDCGWKCHACRRCHEILFECGTSGFILQGNRSGGIETDSKNFRQLKRLLVREVEEESLEYLLQNSLNLRELLLVDAVCLDDALLHEIFKFKNALSQVNTIAVYKCELSREGLKELVQKCVNLEKDAFETLDADVTTLANELKRDIRATYSYVEQNLIRI